MRSHVLLVLSSLVLAQVHCSSDEQPLSREKSVVNPGSQGQGGGGQAGGTSSASGQSGASTECTGKVCGQDCSPPGSDEPFNCTGDGQCVTGFVGDCTGVVTGGAAGVGGGGASQACIGKVCGQDCSPPGSDEPFNCTGDGQCVTGFLGDCPGAAGAGG